jgi:hypothetical protein
MELLDASINIFSKQDILLSHAHLSSSFWADAFQTSCYLINRMPTSLLHNKSPFEVLLQTQTDYSFLHVFNCACRPNLLPYNANKLQPRSLECIFLGYSLSHKGYKRKIQGSVSCQGLPSIARDRSWRNLQP